MQFIKQTLKLIIIDKLVHLFLHGLQRVNLWRPHVLALTRPDGSTIFLLNRGEAVNFVHGAVIGEYVYLVLAEIIEGVHQLAHQASTPGLHELPQATMQRIARLWLTDFHGVTP